MQSRPGDAAPQSEARASRAAITSWILFDWAAQPFYTLILTFLFAPYFASTVVGNTAKGQEIWGYAAAVAGILVGLGSPVLGALADGRGRRKPWIALFAFVFVGAMSLLWLAKPGADQTTLTVIVVAFVIATVMAEFNSVFVNAIMPTLVPPDELGRLSGIGWGIGYAGGLVSLIVMAGLVIVDPTSGKTMLGLTPVVALDVAAHMGERLIGPFAAAWFLVFVIPFFLFVPDVRPGAAPKSSQSPLAELWSTLRSLPAHPDMLIFLLARAIYTDGMSAIFTFGGIYGAAVFGWGAFELGLFGIILVLTGAIGAFAGGAVDRHLGSRRVILMALVVLLIGVTGILSVSKESVLYVVTVPAKSAGSPPFSSVGEQVFLGFALLVGFVAAPVGSASRALLAQLAPPDKMTQFFGLFAFSGKVTAFLAPFLVAMVTTVSGSQRLGMAVIGLFLVAGFVMMLMVRAPKVARG